MTFGCCINMLAPFGGDGSGRELLPLLGSLGFDYVEMPMAQMMGFPTSRLSMIRFFTSGISVTSSPSFTPPSLISVQEEPFPAE